MKSKILVGYLCLFLSAIPSIASVSVIGGLVRTKTALPGEEYEGVILLKNQGDVAADVKIYQADYQFFADGRNVYAEPGTISRSNAKWITLSPTRIRVPARQTSSVYFRVRVPKDAQLSGTFWSLLMIEPAPEPISNGTTNQPTLGVQQIIRTGIQIVTEIGDTGERLIRFSEKKIIKDEAGTLLELNVENIGDRLLAPALAVEIFQTNGVSIGKFDGLKLRVYPGCSVRQRINLSDVPAGRFKAMVIGDNGDEHVFGAQYDLVIEK